MAGKSFGSNTGGLADVLANRFSDPQPQPEPTKAPKTPAAAKASTSKKAPAKPKIESPAMTTRSWYMPLATADELAAAIEHIRHTVPAVTKADAIDALVRYAVQHRDEVSQSLAKSRKV